MASANTISNKMLFYKRVDGKLAAACIVYVDDFLLTCRRDYPKEELLTLFTWGSQKELTMEQTLEFKGKELTLKKVTNGSLHLHVTQTKFIENTDSGKVQRGRIAAGPPLTTAEQTEFRSVTGSLQWLSSQTRPDIAAWSQPGKPWRRYSSFTPRQSLRDLGILPLHQAPRTGVPRCGHQHSKRPSGLCRFLLGKRPAVLLTTRSFGPAHNPALQRGQHQGQSHRLAQQPQQQGLSLDPIASEATACDDCVDRT